jgi:hypothetical protein
MPSLVEPNDNKHIINTHLQSLITIETGFFSIKP